jgi:glycosyltransferase involved in cell wall biosynthesis
MKVCFQQFLDGKHSWSIVGLNTARALKALGHEIHLSSTNGYDNFPNDLRPNIIKTFDQSYDLQFSYTAMLNFPRFLSHGKTNRFGMWCYELPLIPANMVKYHAACDKLLTPSSFARDIFVANKVPADKVIVVPHGINVEDYQTDKKYILKTKKRYKILVNIGQQHLRKNIAGMFEAFGLAFDKNDDVCLVAKIYTKKLESHFDVDTRKLYNNFAAKYKNHAEVELITEFIPNMAELYNACDMVYTLSFSECYYLPGIEGFACNKINIAPRYGGQLDFMNDENSLLVDGSMIRADPKMQYWTPNIHNTVFNSDVIDAANKLRYAVSNYDELLNRFLPNMKQAVKKYTWENSAKKILELVNENNK